MAEIVDISKNPVRQEPKPQTLADDVFDQLRHAILRGELTPGGKISEPGLAARYGISRGPLREAIRRLEGCKLVTVKPNAGARVAALGKAQALEIYEIRESLEGLACRLAARQASARECAELHQLLKDHERQMASANWQHYQQDEGNMDFHYLIVRLSGNRRLFDLLCGELYHLLRLCRIQTSTQPSRPEQALREHQQIADAIANRDGELAELLMRRHVASARDTLLDRLQQKGQDFV